MRSLGERLNLLRKLIAVKCGPGAAVLPPEVTRIHMDFATKINGGHMGARKFWREFLPQLKYHNPAVPMIVNRHDQSSSPPTMSIYLRSPSSSSSDADASSSSSASSDTSSAPADLPSQPASSRTNLSPAPPPASDERVVRIDMKDKHSSAIFDLFLAETRARALQPTRDQLAEMQALEALARDASLDRERVRQLRAKKKEEEDMLKRARAAGGLADQDAA